MICNGDVFLDGMTIYLPSKFNTTLTYTLGSLTLRTIDFLSSKPC